MSGYACEACGCTAFKPPTELRDDAQIRCFACNEVLGSWAQLRDVAVRLIAMDRVAGSWKPTWASADPLPQSDVSAFLLPAHAGPRTLN